MKYIIFDMDDTLLKKDKTISEYSLSILKKLQNQGHKLVINTARSRQYNQKYFDIIKPDYAILNGGAQIVDKDSNSIYLLPVDKNKQEEIIAELLSIANNISLQTDDGFYVSDPKYKNQNPILFDFKNQRFTKDILKILAFIDDDNIGREFAKKYDLAYTSYYNGPCKRMNQKDATKFKGILKLLEITNGKLEDTIAFGDDDGDIEMINKCFEGVLLKNADEKYKSIVRTVSEYSCEEDGLARYLEKHLLGQE